LPFEEVEMPFEESATVGYIEGRIFMVIVMVDVLFVRRSDTVRVKLAIQLAALWFAFNTRIGDFLLDWNSVALKILEQTLSVATNEEEQDQENFNPAAVPLRIPLSSS
jgi:hypothetical protein